MKRLLHVAVSQVHFKCNESCNIQKDGLEMVASLAIFLSKSLTEAVRNCTIEEYSYVYAGKRFSWIISRVQ